MLDAAHATGVQILMDVEAFVPKVVVAVFVRSRQTMNNNNSQGGQS